LAELEIDNWFILREQMRRSERRAYLTERIEADLRREGVPVRTSQAIPLSRVV